MTHRGQSSMETLLLLPLFLLVAFGLLQIGMIGTALVTASYAAGSIARKAVAQDVRQFSASMYEQRLRELLFGGMRYHAMSGRFETAGTRTPNIIVNTCIKVHALPFVGPFVHAALQGRLKATDSCDENSPAVTLTDAEPRVDTDGWRGDFEFVVHGKAKARMNYRP